MFGKIRTFFAEATQELRHVNWPTREEATRLTGIVILISVAIALFLYAFDLLFTYLLQAFVLQ